MSEAAVKYHISPTTGNPNRCYATKKPCPLGGESDHFETKQDARDAYEERMKESAGASTQSLKKENTGTSNVVSMEGHSKSPAVKTEKFNEAVPALRTELSKAEMGSLERLGEGKKVSAEKLDQLVMKTEKLTNKTPYRRDKTVEAARTVTDFVKAAREKDSTPNTVPTLRDFDPATQTTFSNPKARTSAAVAAKSMTRNSEHAKWMEELSSDAARASRDVSYTEEERKEWSNLSAEQSKEAAETRALLQAQVREVTYLSDNDAAFKASMRPDARRMVDNHQARLARETSEYDSIPLVTKKVR